ncbi:SprT family zinc-dependent metalloprotease [Desulfosporosinus sp. PR]|uniref:M48 family metallopeptidase n=1 Tax=Candidatus Desulfosporosinus nitrosoreducens TaxID=3401928 RepID=UPI0027F8E405|nr:SprT family zinc-dependent metalloprotease [Desulfosporosinus sp. PR]MDQ7095182.1 SprT family zinc-dependent metalloprotease [Desulfosporosinus sp. PR]
MDHLKINDEIIPCEERRSKGYRRVTLSILDDRVRISAPKHVSAKQLKELLLAKQEWILTHWLESRQKQVRSSRQYLDGEHFPYRGQVLELRLRRYAQRSIRVSLEGLILRVDLPQDLAEVQGSADVPGAVMAWYKVQARKVLKHKLDEQAQRMQVIYQEFRLKDQKTRWGSCSTRGNLNLNWRIIMAPEEVIDYLVIHELAHLTHPNHSERFWQRVRAFMPEYPTWKKWLKDHGQELVL